MKILSNILLKAGIIVDNYVAIGTNSPYAGYNIDSRGSHNFGNTSTEVYHYFQSSSVNGGSALSVYANNTSANSARSQIMLADTAASVPTRFGLGVYTGATPYAYLDSASKLVINNASGANVIIGNTVDSGQKLQVYGSTLVAGDLTVTNANNATINLGLIQKLTADSGTGVYKFWNGSGGGWSFEWYNNGSTAMTLTSANNLLIGTTTDAGYRLNVNGFFRAGPTAGHFIELNPSYVLRALISNTIYEQDSENIKFTVNNTGNISFVMQTVNRLVVNNNGTITLSSLAGTGNRMVVADSSGVLSTQAIPSITNYVTTDTTQTISGQKTFSALTTIFDSTQTATFIEGRASGVLYGGMSFSLFMQFNAYAAATGGYLWKNGAGNNVMALSQAGALTVTNLAGSGDRMVVADANGVLTTQAIPSGGTSASTRTIQKFTSTANQTTFTITGGYTVGMVDVFLNGVKIDNATDFTATNGTTVVLTEALAAGQTVEVYRYGSQFIVNNGLRQTTLFSATAGQTTFTVSYSVGLVDVFYNGSKLDSSEYTATNGTSIVLGTACAVNDKVEVIAYSYNVSGFTGVGGSGTTNYIPKWTASGTLGNSLIFDNGTNVGIGTATPFGTFNVVAGTNKSLVIQDSGTADTIEIANYSVSGGTRAIAMNGSVLTFGTGTAGGGSATPRLTINATGNVGIGITPQSWFSAYRSLQIAYASLYNDGSVNSYLASNAYVGTDGNFKYGINGALGLSGIEGASWVFYNASSGTAGNTASITERFRITSSGNVGIGTASPNGTLEVYAATPTIISGASSSASFHGLEFRQNNTIDAFIKQLPQTGELKLSVGRNSSWGGHMTFFTDTLERMRITSSGFVCVNTSSKIDDGLISISANAFLHQGIVIANTATANIYYLYFKNSSNAAAGRIEQTGATSVAYASGSDYRLKEDLKDFDGLNKVLSIKTYDFKWKNEDKRDYGVLAHELQEVVSGAVLGRKDELEKDGTIKTQMVDYSKLTPVLVKAIQEEDAKVNAQELRIQQLEQEVITLKSQLGSN